MQPIWLSGNVKWLPTLLKAQIRRKVLKKAGKTGCQKRYKRLNIFLVIYSLLYSLILDCLPSPRFPAPPNGDGVWGQSDVACELGFPCTFPHKPMCNVKPQRQKIEQKFWEGL